MRYEDEPSILTKTLIVLNLIAIWFFGFGILGFFVGLKGVGMGWPSFWTVGLLSLTVPVFYVLIGFITYMFVKK